MNTNFLLADPAAIQIEKFVSRDDGITVIVRPTRKSAVCPQCGVSSSSLKCCYLRRIADLPWHGVAVRLELHARKFRCRNVLCRRKVFCERLSNVVRCYGRKTVRLSEVLTALAFALGGRGGARVAEKLNLAVGKDSLLRVIKRSRSTLSTEEQQRIKVLGVDDFAFRKGCDYGTILVDLEKRKVIDLLPDREAETLKNWLLAHPEIKTVSRDRSTSYAEAVRSGAPQAEQIADRWHLLKNLSELLERILLTEAAALKSAAEAVRLNNTTNQTKHLPILNLASAQENSNASQAQKDRQKLFEKINELSAKGISIRYIGRTLGICRNTVRKYLQAETCPQKLTETKRFSKVAKYGDFLRQRWKEGEQNAVRLWEEIQERGFRGEISSVRRFVQSWRESGSEIINNCRVLTRGFAPRQTAKLLLSDSLTDHECKYVVKLCEINPKIDCLRKLGREFRQIVREKRAADFDGWLAKVKNCEIVEIQKWANGLLTDESAVRNALVSEWSNGQTEGQVNRLKTIKRQMYGRAGFDLLRARIIHQS